MYSYAKHREFLTAAGVEWQNLIARAIMTATFVSIFNTVQSCLSLHQIQVQRENFLYFEDSYRLMEATV